MRRIKNYFLTLFSKIRLFHLKYELRGTFFYIGGYQDTMVKTPSRFLKEWEVKEVHKLRDAGKIKYSHSSTITSPATGMSYTDKMYILIK